MIRGLHAVSTVVWFQVPFLLTGKRGWSSLSGKVKGIVRIATTTTE